MFLLLLVLSNFVGRAFAQTYTLGIGSSITCSGDTIKTKRDTIGINNDDDKPLSPTTNCTIIIPANVAFSSLQVNHIIFNNTVIILTTIIFKLIIS
jgi:hypothetical protein